MEGFINIIYLILALIAAGNISVAVFLTMVRIEKSDNSPKGIATALYFIFTILGIYAAIELLR